MWNYDIYKEVVEKIIHKISNEKSSNLSRYFVPKRFRIYYIKMNK